MADSLQPAALLADRLGDRIEIVLPEGEPVIDDARLAAKRLELRQVAGLGAGGSMELSPGRWDFGPARHNRSSIDDGEPDRVGFTLEVSEDLEVWIEPGVHPVRLGDVPVLGPSRVGRRLINAGSARFVVARPRPTTRRGGVEMPPGEVHPWVTAPLPQSGMLGPALPSLVAQRLRFHLGPEELRHRIESGRFRLWGRGPDHPLFGTAVVGVADIGLTGSPESGQYRGVFTLPVAVDLLASPTVVAGLRVHQLALVRHLLLGLVATVHPRDLRIELWSDRDDLAFLRHLPHAIGQPAGRSVGRGRNRPRTLLVVDREAAIGALPATDEVATLVVGRGPGAVPDEADVVAVTSEVSLAVRSGRTGEEVRGATPIGYGEEMTAALVRRLVAIGAG